MRSISLKTRLDWFRYFEQRAERLDQPAPLRDKPLSHKIAALELYRPKDSHG